MQKPEVAHTPEPVWRHVLQHQPVKPHTEHSPVLTPVFEGVCVLRVDNEAGKGDHRPVGSTESPYTFTTPEQLYADFMTEAADSGRIRAGPVPPSERRWRLKILLAPDNLKMFCLAI